MRSIPCVTCWAKLDSVKDLHVAEIGPGEFLTSVFALLAAGAGVLCRDRSLSRQLRHGGGEGLVPRHQDAWPRLFPETSLARISERGGFPEA